MNQPGDRRDRLKYVQEQISQARGTDVVMDGEESSDSESEEEEVSACGGMEELACGAGKEG